MLVTQCLTEANSYLPKVSVMGATGLGQKANPVTGIIPFLPVETKAGLLDYPVMSGFLFFWRSFLPGGTSIIFKGPFYQYLDMLPRR